MSGTALIVFMQHYGDPEKSYEELITIGPRYEVEQRRTAYLGPSSEASLISDAASEVGAPSSGVSQRQGHLVTSDAGL